MRFNRWVVIIAAAVAQIGCGAGGESLGTETSTSQPIQNSTNETIVVPVDETSVDETPVDVTPTTETPSAGELDLDIDLIGNPDPVELGDVGEGLTFRSEPALTLPARCTGAVDNENTIYCVNPETRELSATLADGSLWWSFVLPGSNDTNEIESVMVTDDWLVLVADRFPLATSMTFEQRLNQYEASVFQKGGQFVRTISLPNSLLTSDVKNAREVAQNPVPVAVHQSESASPLITLGFMPWARSLAGEGSALATFDLSSGELLATHDYVAQSIYQLAVDADGSGVLQVVADLGGNATVNWHEVATLNQLSTDTVSAIFSNSLLNQSDENTPLLNAGNYLDVIDQILPWINADQPSELLFGDADFVPTRESPLPFNEFSFLEEIEGGASLFACSNQGLITQEFNASSLSTVYQLDQCSSLNGFYSGTFRERLGSRGAFTYSAAPLSNVSFAQDRSLQGSVTFNGSDSNEISTPSFVASYQGFAPLFSIDTDNRLDNAIVDSYFSSVRFQYGPDIGNQDVACVTTFEEETTNVIGRFFCDLMFVDGVMESSFNINAEWSGYSPVKVNANLRFGNDYWVDIEWFGPPEQEPELPDFIITSPASEFYFHTGFIDISAADGSRLLLAPVENQFPLMSATLFDSSGFETGNLPLVSVIIKCEERLGESCIVPQ